MLNSDLRAPSSLHFSFSANGQHARQPKLFQFAVLHRENGLPPFTDIDPTTDQSNAFMTTGQTTRYDWLHALLRIFSHCNQDSLAGEILNLPIISSPANGAVCKPVSSNLEFRWSWSSLFILSLCMGLPLFRGKKRYCQRQERFKIPSLIKAVWGKFDSLFTIYIRNIKKHWEKSLTKYLK